MLIYSANGELGDALVERIRMMMKEVEVGDEYVGKVVKTTTFGAFVELAKGTDGLLHISNVSPGQRVETVEDVLNKGDEINVRVVEVDRERGRIGLRLAEDPDIAGKSVEELAGVGTGGGGGGGGGRARDGGGATARDRVGGRDGERGSGAPRRRARLGPSAHTARGRDRERARERAPDRRAPGAPRVRRRAPHHHAAIRACESSPSACPSVRSVALGFWIGDGLGGGERRAGRDLAPARAHAVPRHRALSARRRSTRSSTRWARRSTPAPTSETTSLYTRVLDRHLERAST